MTLKSETATELFSEDAIDQLEALLSFTREAQNCLTETIKRDLWGKKKAVTMLFYNQRGGETRESNDETKQRRRKTEIQPILMHERRE